MKDQNPQFLSLKWNNNTEYIIDRNIDRDIIELLIAWVINYWDEKKRIPVHHESHSIEVSRSFNWIWCVRSKGEDNPEWFIFHGSANYWVALCEYTVSSTVAPSDEDEHTINNDKIIILSDEVAILGDKAVTLSDETIILNRTWYKIDY